MEPVVSIGVVTYNQEKYIRQCIDSILMQKVNFKYELIIGEDCSPDNTREILLEYKEKYPDIIKRILHDENVGPAKNVKSVKFEAKGKYFAGIEGDDFWIDENKLQKQFDFLENHPEYSAVGHNLYHAKPNGEIIYNAVEREKDRSFSMNDFLKKGAFIHCNTLFRRNYFCNPDEKYRKLKNSYTTMGDIVTLAVFLDKGDIYFMGEPMLAHRLTDSSDNTSFSETSKTKLIEYSKMFFKITEALTKYFNGKYDFSDRAANRLGSVYYFLVFKRKDYIIDKKELKELLSNLSFGVKLKGIHYMFRRFFKTLVRKARKLCNRI